MTKDTAFYQASFRHARYYLKRLNELDTQYTENKHGIVHVLADLERERAQIEQAQRWSIEAASDDSDAAELGLYFSMIGWEMLSHYRHPHDLMRWTEQGLRIAHQKNNIAYISALCTLMGNLHLKLGTYRQALDFFQQALEAEKHTNNLSNRAVTYGNMATAYLGLEKAEEALQFSQHALRLYRDLNNTLNVANVTATIASIYMNTSRPHDAVAHLREAEALFRQIGHRPQLMMTLNNLGGALIYVDKLDEAMPILQEAYQMAEAYHDIDCQLLTLLNIGNILGKQEKHHEALPYYYKALEMTKHPHFGSQEYLANALLNLGSGLARTGDFVQGALYAQQSVLLYLRLQKIVLASAAFANLYHMTVDKKNFDTFFDALEESIQTLLQSDDSNHLQHLSVFLQRLSSIWNRATFPRETRQRSSNILRTLQTTGHQPLSEQFRSMVGL